MCELPVKPPAAQLAVVEAILGKHFLFEHSVVLSRLGQRFRLKPVQ